MRLNKIEDVATDGDKTETLTLDQSGNRAADWEQVKQILQQALELDEGERIGFLDAAGLSAEVRDEVESLLSFEQAAENLMPLSAVEFSKQFFDDDDESRNALVGQNIGAYRIVRELGYGGMGAVFLAERADGKFQQRVALKLLKREMNTSALRRRFRQEREILASLEHPNIARLLDAGTTDDKIPFLAMEYVEGTEIDDYCNTHDLTLNQRLDLFRQVCAAVNFAHRNLVVHRDLKPSNILVTNDGIPKLLDFGISKILSSEISEQPNSATVTRLGVMTPSYASPEQIQNKSVTTSTDIYSLGIILYELLSGHRPFEAKEANLKEIYQAMIESNPLPPSALIDTDAKAFKEKVEAETKLKPIENDGLSELKGNAPLSSVDTKQTPHRQTTPQKIHLSAGSLRGDLDNIILKALKKEPERRYLSAESFAEDIKRHQNGLPVTARPDTFSYRVEKFIKRNRASVFAGALILLTLVAGLVTTLWQARVARIERARAEKRFNDVRKLANSNLFDVYPEIENLEGSLKAREAILKNALEYLDSLSQEAGGDLDLQRELATAYEKVGDVEGSIHTPSQGDFKTGLESYRKAQQLREAASNVAPENAEITEELAKNYQTIAQTSWWNNDTAGAEDYYEKAIKIRRQLVANDPASIVQQNRLAVLLSDYAGIPIYNIQNDKASQLLEESANITRRVLKTNPDHFPSQKALPRALRTYSRLKANMGDFDGAIKDLDESVVLTEQIVKQKPDDYVLRRTEWLNTLYYCEVYLIKKDGKNAVESCLKSIDFNVKALEKEPDEAAALNDLATTYADVARAYRFSGNPKSSIEYAGKAIEVMSKLDKISPGNNDYIHGISVYETEIAESLLTLHQPEKSLEYLQKAIPKLEKVIEIDNKVPVFQADLTKAYRLSAQAYNTKGEKQKALEYIDKAIVIITRLKEQNNINVTDGDVLAEAEKEKADYSE